MRSDLPTAEFAFISACHTAEVTQGSIIDEVLHLAAAVQYCGFKSLVGTMWAMNGRPGWTGPGGTLLPGIVLHFFETRARDTVSRKIRESTPVRGEEATEEETDHPGAMGKFRSLWRMTWGCL